VQDTGQRAVPGRPRQVKERIIGAEGRSREPDRDRASELPRSLLALALVFGLTACGARPAQPASSPAPVDPSETPGSLPRAPEGHDPDDGGSEAARSPAAPDGGAPTDASATASEQASPPPVEDADSTCMRDDDCTLTRYVGCCCSTVEAATPTPYAISKADLESRQTWCKRRLPRIRCDVQGCPPPATEQPEPAPRKAKCEGRVCVSYPASTEASEP
jgi:hypothetical protein